MLKPIGETLVDSGVVSRDQINVALAAQRHYVAGGERKLLGDVLVEFSFISREVLEGIVRERMGHAATPVELPPALVHDLRIRPVGVRGEDLLVQCFTPLNSAQKFNLTRYLADSHGVGNIREQIVDRREVLHYLRSVAMVTPQIMQQLVAQLNRNASDARLLDSVIRNVFADALQARASDVHITRASQTGRSWIRFRVDGQLESRYLLTPAAVSALATRIKSDASMDATDTQRPQDGRMGISYRDRRIDLRIATQPIEGGEVLAIRLLDPGSVKPLQAILGVHPEVMRRLQAYGARMMGKDSGVILVTGATGQGKTTTLYALIREMPRLRLNVLTVEDPVEITMPLVSQVSIHEAAGMTFERALKSNMRQDGDVLILGEVRDAHTAEVALRFAESGHLVVGTLHTSSVRKSLSRMIGLLPEEARGVGLFTLAHNLKVILNQRLVPRLCTCAVPQPLHELSASQREVIDSLDLPAQLTLRRRIGCAHCKQTGLLGRVVVPEAAFFPDDALVREQMEAALRGNGNLLDVPGVDYYSREASVASLLAQGVIDIDAARAGLQRHQED
jgi:type II secretory ATPase GspE/PulE/Tfp pilus assembly ATPase PilB-like protein